MTEDERGDRPVPPLDADLMMAVAPVGRKHGMQNTAEAMLRWSASILNVLAGPHDAADQLERFASEYRAEHRRLGQAEARQRGERE